MTASGYALEPAIVVPPETQTFTVGEDGTVSITVAGDAAVQVIGNIQTADFINRPACRRWVATCSWRPQPAARRRSVSRA